VHAGEDAEAGKVSPRDPAETFLGRCRWRVHANSFRCIAASLRATGVVPRVVAYHDMSGVVRKG
jgi:hypothetical protein